jgi:hypothetical protein
VSQDDPAAVMISLTYLSTATDAFSIDELEQLLGASREANHARGLTGMLLYAGGHFIQTLEGPESVVDATYEEIARDPRHRDVFVALRETIESRVFPDWSMGFELLTLSDAAHLPGFTAYVNDRATSVEEGEDLGRAGIFHRAFRDNMR